MNTKESIHATIEMQKAGAQVLFDKQFENTPWQGKIKLIDPATIQEYETVACNVYFAMERARLEQTQ